jgi:hemerythrin
MWKDWTGNTQSGSTPAAFTKFHRIRRCTIRVTTFNTFRESNTLEFLELTPINEVLDESSPRGCMALMTWNNELAIGVPSMDAQHVALVETLNELHNALMNGDARNLGGSILRSLLAYTKSHLSPEETVLAAERHPELARHQLMDRDLTLKVEGIVARYDKGELILNLQLLHLLNDWLTNHIQKIDRSSRPWLAEQPTH